MPKRTKKPEAEPADTAHDVSATLVHEDAPISLGGVKLRVSDDLALPAHTNLLVMLPTCPVCGSAAPQGDAPCPVDGHRFEVA